MKKIIILIAFVMPFLVIAQDSAKFVLTSKVGIDPVVIKFDSLDRFEIYKKSKDWIMTNNGQIETDIPGGRISYNGYKWDAYKFNGVKNSIAYTLTIDIKDSKIRVTITPKRYAYTDFFKKNGEVRDMYKNSMAQYDKAVNDILKSLLDYINSNKVYEFKRDDW